MACFDRLLEGIAALGESRKLPIHVHSRVSAGGVEAHNSLFGVTKTEHLSLAVVAETPAVPSEQSTTLRLGAIKTIHTAIWATVEAAVGYLIFSGITKRTNRLVTASAVIVVAETAIFTANGFTCPLTQLGESGSVTDIYLPNWPARSLPAIHTPLAILILYLHRERF